MSDSLTVSILLALLVGVIIGRLTELFGATGLLHVRRELEIEVELNVKLLKENETLAIRCELLADRNDVLIEHHFSHHPELSPSRADSFPAQENVGAVSGHARADVSPETTCCCMFCHCNEKTDLINSDNNVCDSCIKGAHFPSNDGNL